MQVILFLGLTSTVIMDSFNSHYKIFLSFNRVDFRDTISLFKLASAGLS